VEVIQREKIVLLLSGIFVVMSCILQGVDSLKNIRGGEDESDLDSGERAKVEHRVPSINTLLVKVLDSMKNDASYKKII